PRALRDGDRHRARDRARAVRDLAARPVRFGRFGRSDRAGRGVTRILAIESSCDETAAAVVQDRSRVLSSIVASQNDLHAKYGGVVPELASRRHVEAIGPVVREALAAAGLEF